VIALALAALFGAMLSAPVAVLAWEHRHHVRPLIRVALRRRSHQRTMPRPRVQLVRHGAHATPRGGTPIPTAAQIAAPTAQKALTA
jgi:hypothetical protein